MSRNPCDPQQARHYRFGVFEADIAAGELRRQGLRVKLNAQPFQLLCLLLERPGELLTREEISRELWPDGTFVDFDHGVNSAINRIREVLGDTAANPRFVETLARRGYRFIAPVERVDVGATSSPASASLPLAAEGGSPTPESLPHHWVLSSSQELPHVPHRVPQLLFVLFQLMYLGFYIGALANLAEIDELLSPISHAATVFNVLLITAAILIPVRAFVLTAAVFRAPGFPRKFLRLWPFLLLFDVLWSLSPFLLLHHINIGLALACTTLLVYSPFAQRALVLMGAGAPKQATPAH